MAHTSPFVQAATGLGLVSATVAVANLAVAIPGMRLIGPIALAMLIGVGLRTLVLRDRLKDNIGVAFASRSLLRFGIVLLGARVDVRAVAELGVFVSLGSVLGVFGTMFAMEYIGRRLRIPTHVRRALAIGTAVCGASAIAAAIPVLRSDERSASMSVAAISLIGTLAAIGFVIWNAVFPPSPELLSALAGASLQEVGQVLAAGSVLGESGAETALVVKLSRVLMLAPALVLLGVWERQGMRASRTSRSATTPGNRVAPGHPSVVPGFVIGFLAMAASASTGLLPVPTAAALGVAGSVLTALAMAGIGLNVDLRSARVVGGPALLLGLLGFAALLCFMLVFYLQVAKISV